MPERIRTALVAVGLDAARKHKGGGAHSVSTSTQAGSWRPNPCTDLERAEWLALVRPEAAKAAMPKARARSKAARAAEVAADKATKRQRV